MTNLLSGFLLGIKCHFEALTFMTRHRLLGYFLFPLALTVILVITGISITGWLSDLLLGWIGIDDWEMPLPEFLGPAVKTIFLFVFWILWYTVIAFYLGYLVLILLTPILGILSTKTEAILTGDSIPFRLGTWLAELVRGITVAIRNIFWQTIFTILLFLLGFMPLVGSFAPLLLFLVVAYFYGYAFIDFNHERKGWSIGKGRRYMERHRGMGIGLGFPVAVVLLLPFLGPYLACYLAVSSTVAATLAVHQAPDREMEESL